MCTRIGVPTPLHAELSHFRTYWVNSLGCPSYMGDFVLSKVTGIPMEKLECIFFN